MVWGGNEVKSWLEGDVRARMENHGEVEVMRKSAAVKNVVCEVCCRGSDRERHKCLAEEPGNQ